MHKKKSKLRERTQLVFIYGLMTISIVAILLVLVLVIQGYRYNRYDNKIEQGGLVQFDSRPNGATVAVDGIELANRTASKITLTSGSHTISMNRSGYNEWKKTVTVKPGGVLWLNYALLFPTTPQRSVVTEFESPTSAITSPDRNWMAVIGTPSSPSVSLIRLDGDNPSVTTVPIPATSYTAATDTSSQQFLVTAWDKDSQQVLIRHDYDSKQEFIVLNLRGDGSGYNVSSRLGVAATKVEFSDNDAKTLYVLTEARELRRANISSTTLSGPLASNVSDFTAAGQTIVTYETYADANGKRAVGYISSGSDVTRQIASYLLADDVVLHARAGIYYGDRYVLIARGTTVDILKSSLPSSDSDGKISTKTVAQLTDISPDYLGFSPDDNRIVYAQSGAVVRTYDLELDSLATLTFASAPSGVVTWIDEFHIAATAGAAASYYDYDGTNGQVVSSTATNLPLALSSNDKYLYYFTPATSGASTILSRIRMTQ